MDSVESTTLPKIPQVLGFGRVSCLLVSPIDIQARFPTYLDQKIHSDGQVSEAKDAVNVPKPSLLRNLRPRLLNLQPLRPSRESKPKSEPTERTITTGWIMGNSHGLVGGVVARIGTRPRHPEMLSELSPELAPCE